MRQIAIFKSCVVITQFWFFLNKEKQRRFPQHCSKLIFFSNALVATEVSSYRSKITVQLQSRSIFGKTSQIVVAVNYDSTHAVFGDFKLPIEQPQCRNADEETVVSRLQENATSRLNFLYTEVLLSHALLFVLLIVL